MSYLILELKNNQRSCENHFGKCCLGKKITQAAREFYQVLDCVTDSSVLSSLLAPRMFSVWDIRVGIFARKAKFNMNWLLL